MLRCICKWIIVGYFVTFNIIVGFATAHELEQLNFFPSVAFSHRTYEYAGSQRNHHRSRVQSG